MLYYYKFEKISQFSLYEEEITINVKKKPDITKTHTKNPVIFHLFIKSITPCFFFFFK